LLRVDSRKVASPQQLRDPSRPGTTQRAVTICDEASGASGMCNLGPGFAHRKWAANIFFACAPHKKQPLGRDATTRAFPSRQRIPLSS